MKEKILVRSFGLAACLFAGLPAQAALQFDWDFQGAFVDGVNDPAQQQAVVNAGVKFSQLFGRYFSDSAVLQLQARGSDDPATDTLMSAASFTLNRTGFGVGDVVRRKVQSGIDINGTAADGFIDVNFAFNWQLDHDVPAVASGQDASWDFYATFHHEFTHALGFSTVLNARGTDLFGNGNADTGEAGTWAKFDDFLNNCRGSFLINGSTGLVNQAVYDSAKSGADHGVCFGGSNAVAANGGVQLQMFTLEGEFRQGNVISHVLQDPFAQTLMMKWNRDTGPQEARDYHPVEVGLLTDLGYTPVAAIPEPGTALLWAAGLGLLVVRRCKP